MEQPITEAQCAQAEADLAKIKDIRKQVMLLVQNKADKIIYASAMLIDDKLGKSDELIAKLTDWQKDGLGYASDALGDTFDAKEAELREIIEGFEDLT